MEIDENDSGEGGTDYDRTDQSENAEDIGTDNSNDSGPSNTRPTKQRANVWQHFDEIIENGIKFAKCNHCLKRYKISGSANGSTGNMNAHLTKKHPDKMLQIDETVDEPFVFSQETFRKALMKWMVVCDQPFTAPEQEAFVDMVKTLNPDAKLYSDKTMRADLLSLFNEKFNELKERLREVPGKISITMDGWTSKNFLPFLAIRAHWLDKQWDYQTQLLDFCHIEGSHSGKNFKELFTNALQSLNIPLDKIMAITVDNASSNDTFFDELEEIFDMLGDDQHIRCLAHIINLAAQDVLKSLKYYTVDLDEEHPLQDELSDELLDDIDLDLEIDDSDEFEFANNSNDADTKIVVKLRTLVRKIRNSVLLRQKLSKLCSIYSVKYLVPILDVKTRWNSTFDMILRAEHLKTPLKVLCTNEPSLTNLHITDREWLDLFEIKHLLHKFQRATQLVSMERHSTIHAYLPTLDWLIVSLKSIVRGSSSSLVHSAEAGLKKLQKYEEIVYESKIPFIATFLNPALKLNYLKEHKYSNSKIREVKNMISGYFSDNYENELESDDPAKSESEDDELYSHMYKRSKVDRISSEIKKYLNLPLESPKTSPLEYWRSTNIQNTFPKLSKMARDVLPIQSSSVAVERDFSKGARVVTPKRCALIAETIRASMFVKSCFVNTTNSTN